MDGAATAPWLVTAPIEWLKPGFVLVDTPGTDEDEARCAIASTEMARADAALVVLRADQLGPGSIASGVSAG